MTTPPAGRLSPAVMRLRERAGRDDGTSLIEVMVGMVLMSIFLAMFTGAILMMNASMNTSQGVNLTAAQLNAAFLAVDSTVRDAGFISTPRRGKASGDWYVELRSTDSGAEVCTQLRVNNAAQQLQQRSWTVLKTVASSPTAWVPIASGISNGNASSGTPGQPFSLVPPRSNEVFQQLRITLISPSGSGASLTTSTSSFTITALNSVVPAPTAPICQQQGWP